MISIWWMIRPEAVMTGWDVSLADGRLPWAHYDLLTNACRNEIRSIVHVRLWIFTTGLPWLGQALFVDLWTFISKGRFLVSGGNSFSYDLQCGGHNFRLPAESRTAGIYVPDSATPRVQRNAVKRSRGQAWFVSPERSITWPTMNENTMRMKYYAWDVNSSQ